MTPTCEWHSGADRNVLSVPAAIASYHFPPATQRELIAQWEERRWADTIVIDRDSIRGLNADYAPDIRQMHYGAGKVCQTVTRASWTPKQTETAIVLCADGECVAIPSACTNVARVTRIERSAPLAGPAYLDGSDLIPAGPIGTGPGYATSIPLAPAISDGQGYGASWGEAAGFGYAVAYLPGECACCGVAVPAAPVPEPSSLVLLIGGLAAVAAWSKRA